MINKAQSIKISKTTRNMKNSKKEKEGIMIINRLKSGNLKRMMVFKKASFSTPSSRALRMKPY
jgi:hypothetical protein